MKGQRLAWWLLVLLGLAACGPAGGGGMPTLVPTAAVVPAPGDSSPRLPVTNTPDSRIPPTWTPPPVLEATATATSAGSEASYTVQAGDTLGQIAERYGVTVEALVEANEISDPDHIEVGTVLLIPSP